MRTCRCCTAPTGASCQSDTAPRRSRSCEPRGICPTGLRGAVEISREKIQTLADFWPLAGFFFDGPVDDPKAFEKVIGRDGGAETLEAARGALAAADPFTLENVEAALREVVEVHGGKAGRVFQPVRVAIAGTTVSPGIFESVTLLGREETLARIDKALDRAKA
jgi:glutamyl-tRNA synthetase